MLRAILILFIFCRSSLATDYYVDATGGIDAADGLTTGTAWQTISKLNSLAFGADTIYLKRGETWLEEMKLTDDNGVTIDAYGSGDLPVIDGENKRPNGINAVGSTDVTVRNLHLKNPTPHGSTGAGFQCNGISLIEGCELTGAGDANAANGAGTMTLNRCLITTAYDDGVTSHGTGNIVCNDCVFDGNSQAYNTSGTAMRGTFNGCVFKNSKAADIYPDPFTTTVANRCLFMGRPDLSGDALKMWNGSGTANYCIFEAVVARCRATTAWGV